MAGGRNLNEYTMHYKNGRPVELGDFVVGTSHNSQGRIVFGIVLEQMPQQGPCNIKIVRIELTTRDHAEKREAPHIPIRIGKETEHSIITGSFEDYGDAANFLKCEDGLRLAKSAQYGKWDCPYFI